MYIISRKVIGFYIDFVGIKESYTEAETYLINELGCKKVVLNEGTSIEVVYYENGIKDEFGMIPRYVIEKQSE